MALRAMPNLREARAGIVEGMTPYFARLVGQLSSEQTSRQLGVGFSLGTREGGTPSSCHGEDRNSLGLRYTQSGTSMAVLGNRLKLRCLRSCSGVCERSVFARACRC